MKTIKLETTKFKLNKGDTLVVRFDQDNITDAQYNYILKRLNTLYPDNIVLFIPKIIEVETLKSTKQ